MKEFEIKTGEIDPEPLLKETCLQVASRRGPFQARRVEEYLTRVGSAGDNLILFLMEMPEDKPGGFVIFGKNKIHFLYLRPELPDKKLASYRLAHGAVSLMKEQGADFIISDCARFGGFLGDPQLTGGFELLDFFSSLFVISKIVLSRYIAPSIPGCEINQKFTFYNYTWEHREKALEFITDNPDSFAAALFATPQSREIRRSFYHREIFRNETGEKEIFSPDLSTIIYKGDECAGLLLAGDEGMIVNLRVSPNAGHNQRELMNLLLDRLGENIDENSASTIAVSWFEKDQELQSWAKAAGFREITAYPVWGWSKYM